ncbi:MAG: hypothetical protein K6G20_12405 [Ruminococcus sp.]|nr:hypothetical protein [Ruminococcus sp.]
MSKGNIFEIIDGKVYINGTPIHKVTAINVNINASGLNEVTLSFEVYSYPERPNIKLGNSMERSNLNV